MIKDARTVVPAPGLDTLVGAVTSENLKKPLTFLGFWLPGPPWTLKLPEVTPTMAQSGPQLAPGGPRKQQNYLKLLQTVSKLDPK